MHTVSPLLDARSTSGDPGVTPLLAPLVECASYLLTPLRVLLLLCVLYLLCRLAAVTIRNYALLVLLLLLSASNMTDPDQEVNKSLAEAVSAAVSVKPPPFDETSVTRWFNIVESQFILAGITQSSTKFHHILANLPVRIINQLSDNVVSTADYDKLQKALVALFARSKPELFDTLVSQNGIIMQKPTVYLQQLRKIAAQLDVKDDFLKIKFLKALPNTIRPLLVTYDPTTSLEELARVADTLMAYSGDNTQSNVCAVSENTYGQCNSASNVYHVQHNSDDRNRGLGNASRSSVPDFSHASIPTGVRAFHRNQRPRVCRYHLYYGSNAKSCKKLCFLFSPQLKILPDSRSSSPVPSYGSQSGN